MSVSAIKDYANSIQSKLIRIRRHIHQHPELSDQEAETMKYISSVLQEWGIEHCCNIGGYGITGTLKGYNPEGSVLLLRADMDALPIEEKNAVPYCSIHKGVMHACGHDVHSTCLLGALSILNHFKNDWTGTIKFVFQPAEEKLPGGAKRMIEAGVLDNPKPDAAIALHVFPSLETGEVGFRSGMYMASCDEIYINITGIGGHAAVPADINNPLYAASDVLLTLEQLATDYKHANVPTVLSFGNLHANGATNVVPDVCTIAGTFRTMNETWRSQCHQQILDTIQYIAEKRNIRIDSRIDKGYPFLINDDTITQVARAASIVYLGESNVKALDIRMASEDFAYYSQQVPSCFFRLGTGNKNKGITAPVHTATFDIDEDALPIGAGLLAHLAITLQSKYPQY